MDDGQNRQNATEIKFNIYLLPPERSLIAHHFSTTKTYYDNVIQ